MIYIIVAVLLIIIDQVAKALARTFLAGGFAVGFIPHIIDFVYVENRGAAFGIMQDTRMLLIIMTLIIITALFIYIIKTKQRHPLFLFSSMLIIAGGIGNLIDRIIFGYVTDFIHFMFFDFPCFNIADICVCIGAVLIVIYLLFNIHFTYVSTSST